MAESGEKKEKKPRPPPPPPPPALATASLLIRGAAARVMGLRAGLAGGELQPVWVTEPGQAKVTISLNGCSRSPFPKDEEHDRILEAIEMETTRLSQDSRKVSVFELDKATAQSKYGDSVLDSNVKDDGSGFVRLAHLPGAILVQVPSNWQLCATTDACGSVTFQKGVEEGSKKKPDTMILHAGKKKQMMVRYAVGNATAPGDASEVEQPSTDIAQELDCATVQVQIPGIDTDIAETATKSSAEKEDKATAGADMIVDPWSVKGKIDYRKLIEQFGSTEISSALLERITKLTVGKGNVPKLHRWLTRNIFFSHRDLDHLCGCVEKGKPFYLYTGRGPSSASMHLGHLIPFMMTKWLQDAFQVPLVIQMTDDEKFLWKGSWEPEVGDNLMHFRNMTTENAKDIIACGFDKDKTFIFSDLDYFGHMYPNIVRIWKAITYNTARGAFGFVGESNIGQSAFPAVQAAPSFPSTFKVPLKGQDNMACLIPCAIDQDPYFRVTRDIAHKLVPKDHPLKGKPSLIHSKFFPPLQGAQGKMSSSDDASAVFLTDTPEEIELKIKKYAFSGGRVTAKEQKEKGANIDVDVSYQWLRFFLEDDEELDTIGREYGSGQGQYWNTGSVKDRLIAELKKIVAAHQERRAKITDEEVAEWMRVRELHF